MTFWLDEQLDPELATWLGAWFTVIAKHVRELDLAQTSDLQLFEAARRFPEIVIITKDYDLVDLVQRRGAPPQILWLTCGNMRTPRLHVLLSKEFPKAIELLRAGEPLVEIAGGHSSAATPS